VLLGVLFVEKSALRDPKVRLAAQLEPIGDRVELLGDAAENVGECVGSECSTDDALEPLLADLSQSLSLPRPAIADAPAAAHHGSPETPLRWFALKDCRPIDSSAPRSGPACGLDQGFSIQPVHL